MFGEKTAQIKGLEEDKKYWKDAYHDLLTSDGVARIKRDAEVRELVERLAKAKPVYIGPRLSSGSFGFSEKFEPTKKPEPPKDETPMGDLRRYVEALEEDAKINQQHKEAESKREEINRLADQKVAAHVAKLHKARKKK